MLTLIMAESSLETIPSKVLKHPQVQRHARKVGKKPEYMMLDKSYHYHALGKLGHKEKRGRPDIVHITLLEALGSPLNLEGLLQSYVHTFNDYILYVNPEIRLPRNYNRFIGLMEQLFRAGKAPPRGEALLRLERGHLHDLTQKLRPSYVVAFTRVGERHPVADAARKLSKFEKPAVVVGGFPHGHFSKQSLGVANESVCIDPSGLDAWVVTSRIISAYEEAIDLPGKRLRTVNQRS